MGSRQLRFARNRSKLRKHNFCSIVSPPYSDQIEKVPYWVGAYSVDSRQALRASRSKLHVVQFHWTTRKLASLVSMYSAPYSDQIEKVPYWVPFLFGGGRWIRTTEVSDNRFTVCPLWPLGNSPILPKKEVELVKGVEPPTC